MAIQNQDSINTVLLINHLRENFDDIHDVSMRFHHQDHTQNGLIVLHMQWENGALQSAEAVQNETGNPDFAAGLIEKIKTWSIPALDGPFEINLPLRIRIVGLTDSTFAEKSIFTGQVTDTDGQPVHRAMIRFNPVSNPQDSVAVCYSNREGIFVRTLIPPGTWALQISGDGYQTTVIKEIEFKAGAHLRYAITLKP
ncbi:MAG: carboxypeptidase regulatory-like domain-containing protein [Calditrichales bacterium]|nr:MAG: carboxypeptidase regulatory-like domain-containing protein [Calditrichales bacterium]